MNRSTLAAAAALAALALPSVARANEGFAAIAGTGRLATFTEQSQPYLLSLSPITSPVRHARIVALDGLPSGGLLALDADGRIFDLDVARSRLAPRFDGRAVAGAVDSASSLTFTVARDGGSVLVVSRDVARRVDLATGEVRQIPKPTTGGTQESLALDTLPDGRLFGIEGGAHDVLREDEPGGGHLERITPLRIPVLHETRLTVSADGVMSWLITRLSARGAPQSRWVRIDPQTGAATGNDGPFFLRAFDAVATTGDRPEITAKPNAHVDLPRTVSRRRLARDRGLVFTVRSDQPGQTVASLRDTRNRVRGFGFATAELPDHLLRVTVSSRSSDQRRLPPRFRVHIAVHGIARDQVRTIDRWVHVSD